MTQTNDIVLIYFEDNPVGFARVEDIQPDHKKDWYHIKLLLLQIPLQTVTWILKDVYINGEPFTMNGNRMRLEKVTAPQDPTPAESPEPEIETETRTDNKKPEPSSKNAKVISLQDRK